MTTSASNMQTASLMLTLSTGLQLLAFFVVLNATAKPDAVRSRTLMKSFEESPDGNEVVLEEQMQKVGDTRSQYNTAAQLMQSNMKMLRMALGKGGG